MGLIHRLQWRNFVFQRTYHGNLVVFSMKYPCEMKIEFFANELKLQGLCFEALWGPIFNINCKKVKKIISEELENDIV